MKHLFITFFLSSFFLISCIVEPDPPYEEPLYFPPISGTWESISISEAGFNASKTQELIDYLNLKHTKGFIMLKNGKIVMENYFNGHDANAIWYWASAGKTLTATVTGIAEQEGLLDTNNKVSTYLGTAWTSAPLTKENLITCKHLLTMTSGLDDTTGDDVSPQNLQYKADAGTRWAYHNVYVKLQDVVAAASGTSWSNYFNTKLRDKIGMNGLWYNSDGLSVYYSNTRSMARFGLLALNNGKWDHTQIINSTYFNKEVNTSQNLNKSYGYLWWLNGKESFMLPQTQLVFNGTLIPTAPSDMYAALGKNDQKIYVIPSRKIVIVRMGEAADGTNVALSDFDEVLWEKIMQVINN